VKYVVRMDFSDIVYLPSLISILQLVKELWAEKSTDGHTHTIR